MVFETFGLNLALFNMTQGIQRVKVCAKLKMLKLYILTAALI